MPLSDFLDGISVPLSLSIIPPFVGREKQGLWINSPDFFLVPKIDYIQKFAEGELGIADSIKKEFFYKNLKLMKDPEAIEIFLKVSGSKLTGDLKSLTSGGKLNISKDDIQIDPAGDFLGLKALEVTTIKSMFEAQKPYMEIIEIFIKSMAKVEDIMCRLAAFPAMRCEKPTTNPNALGFNKMSVNKKQLSEMRKSATRKIGDDGSSLTPGSNTTNTGGVDQSSVYEEKQIISEVYSTGQKLDGYDYEYEYINLYEDQTVKDEDIDPFPDDFEFKPSAIILGYFDESGNALNPPDWVKSSGKWYPGVQVTDDDGNEVFPSLPNGNFPQMPDNTSDTTSSRSNNKKKFKSKIKAKIDATVQKLRQDPKNPLVTEGPNGDIDLGVTDPVEFLKNKLELVKMIMDTLDGDINEASDNTNNNSFLRTRATGINFGSKGAFESRDLDFPIIGTSSSELLQSVASVDPETEYWIRVIEVKPSNSVPANNSHLLHTGGTTIFGKQMTPLTAFGDVSSVGQYNQDPTGYKMTAKPYFNVDDYEPKDDANGNPIPQGSIGTLYRYDATTTNAAGTTVFVDPKTYYIIEAVLPPDEDNAQKNKFGAGQTSTGPKYYKGMKAAIGAVKPMASLLIDIITKLFPKIKKLMKLFKNPTDFLAGIIQEKAKDGFLIFTDKFINDFTSLYSTPAGLTAGVTPRAELQKARKKIVDNNPYLKNLIYIETDIAKDNYVNKTMGDMKFLLDGVSGMQLFNFKFGIGVNFNNIFDKKPPVYPDIGKLSNIPPPKLECGVGQNLETNSSGANVIDLDLGVDGRIFGNGSVASNLLDNTKGSSDTLQIVTTRYSTGLESNPNGVKLEGYQYEYFYINEEILDLFNKGEELEKQIDDEPDPSKQQDLLNQALLNYTLALKKDPQNRDLKDKIDSLKSKNVKFQPIMQFLVNLVSFPIKIILQIVQEIICLFKGMTLANLPKKLKEFFSFKWLLKLFKPMKILELLGIKLDIPKFKDWVNSYNDIIKPAVTEIKMLKEEIKKAKDAAKVEELRSKIIDLINRIKEFKFDLAEVISLPIIPPLPGYSAETFQAVLKQPLLFINAILCLIEAIINGLIEFIWSLLNIGKIVKAPRIKLCKDFGEKLSIGDIVDLIKNGGLGDVSDPVDPDGDPNANVSKRFVFDIKTSDGRNLQDLDREELQKFIEENDDLDFEFDFNTSDFGI